MTNRIFDFFVLWIYIDFWIDHTDLDGFSFEQSHSSLKKDNCQFQHHFLIFAIVLREWPRGFLIFCFVVYWWIFEWRLSNLTGFYWNISTASRWFRIDSMSSVSSSLPQSWRNYEGNSWDCFPVKFNRCAYIPEQLGRVLTWTVPQLSEEWLLPVSTPFLNLYYVPEGMTKGISEFLFRWVLMDFQTWPFQ